MTDVNRSSEVSAVKTLRRPITRTEQRLASHRVALSLPSESAQLEGTKYRVGVVLQYSNQKTQTQEV